MIDTLVLDLETFGPNLEAIHLFNGKLSRNDGVIGNKSKPFGFSRVSVHIDFRTNDIAKGIKGSGKVCIGQIMGKVINEEVGARGSFSWSGVHGVLLGWPFLQKWSILR